MPYFILTKRKNYPNYYVCYKNPITGKYGTKKCTKTPDKTKAEEIAFKWLVENASINPKRTLIKNILDSIRTTDLTVADTQEIINILKNKGLLVSALLSNDLGDTSFIDFLSNFWTPETSPYIKEKLRKQHGIHARYITKNFGAVKNYWAPFFKDMRIGSLTKKKLNEFIDWMGESPTPARRSSKNAIIKAGTVALRWAYKNDYLPKDITEGLIYFSNDNRKREILTPEMAMAVFQRPWKNQTSKLANLLAMCTGLRAGEIQGLRKQDLGINCLYINHSWSFDDGLKTTKNKESRIAEIVFPELMGALIDQANSNPYEEDLDGYIFWASIPNKPMEGKQWLYDLREECKNIGIKNPSWVTFHGWRHFFATYMHGKVQDKILQKATGHKTNIMLQHYADHSRDEDIRALQEAQREVFAPIVNLINW